MKNKDIIISEGKRAWWETSLAGIFYTAALYFVVEIVFNLYTDFSEETMLLCIDKIGLIAFAVGLAIKFSFVNNIHLDLASSKYKKEYAVGPVKIGKWMDLPNIEYVSVFRQAWSKDGDGDGLTDDLGYRYDVNIWHDTSKHFTIYSNNEPEPCFEMAKIIAIRLNTDLLDATTPNDSKWIELLNEKEQPAEYKQ